MEKSFEMDFDEWELLPDPRLTGVDLALDSDKSLLMTKNIDLNYFSNDKNPSPPLEEQDECKDICVVPPPPQPPAIPAIAAELRDVAPPTVLFKKMMDDEFVVDMKIESPNIVMPPVEPGKMMFDSEEEDDEGETFYRDEKNSEKQMDYAEPDVKENWLGIKIWRWRVMGSVGALCSVGITAATLCIFMLGGRQMQKQQQHRDQKIQFQIYTDEKRINQVVQEASRLNHALLAVRGVPMTRAHISFGGYYDGL